MTTEEGPEPGGIPNAHFAGYFGILSYIEFGTRRLLQAEKPAPDLIQGEVTVLENPANKALRGKQLKRSSG